MKEKIIDVIESLQLPESVEISEEGENGVLSYQIMAGSKPMDVKAVIKDEIASILGTKTYGSHFREEAKGEFLSEMKATYPQYSIYPAGQTLRVNRRCSYINAEDLRLIMDQYQADAVQAVSIFERNCVDFFSEGNEEKEKHKLDVQVKEVKETKSALESTDIEGFDKRKKAYTQSVVSSLVKGSGGAFKGKAGHIPDGDNEVIVEQDGYSIWIAYESRLPENKGTIISSDLNENQPDLITAYEDGVLSIGGYILPDKYMPDAPEEFVSRLKSVFHEAFQSVEKLVSKQDPMQVASDIQDVLNAQLEDLSSREAEYEKRVKAFEALEEKRTKEINDLMDKLRGKEAESAKKEAELQEEKAQLEAEKKKVAEEAEGIHKENQRYMLQYEQLVREIKRLKERQGTSPSGTDNGMSRKEAVRLNAEIEQLKRQRVLVEQNLNAQLKDVKTSNKELRDLLSEREREIQKMNNNMEDQASQLFAKREAAYKKEIEDLRAQTDITREDLHIESLEKYVKDHYLDVRHLHGRDFDNISFKTEDGLSVRVVFSDPIYIDVVKDMMDVHI